MLECAMPMSSSMLTVTPQRFDSSRIAFWWILFASALSVPPPKIQLPELSLNPRYVASGQDLWLVAYNPRKNRPARHGKPARWRSSHQTAHGARC